MKDIQQAKELDLSAVLKALHKASQQARETAIQTNTGIVIVKDGELIRIPAERLRKEKNRS